MMGARRPQVLLVCTVGVLLLLPVAFFLVLKRAAGRNAEVIGMSWNSNHTCSVTTYFPSLGERTLGSRFFYFLSSPAFFRVHDARGALLRSSEWLLFQNESDDESPKWVGNGQLVYPTSKGYEGWTLPECSGALEGSPTQ